MNNTSPPVLPAHYRPLANHGTFVYRGVQFPLFETEDGQAIAYLPSLLPRLDPATKRVMVSAIRQHVARGFSATVEIELWNDNIRDAVCQAVRIPAGKRVQVIPASAIFPRLLSVLPPSVNMDTSNLVAGGAGMPQTAFLSFYSDDSNSLHDFLNMLVGDVVVQFDAFFPGAEDVVNELNITGEIVVDGSFRAFMDGLPEGQEFYVHRDDMRTIALQAATRLHTREVIENPSSTINKAVEEAVLRHWYSGQAQLVNLVGKPDSSLLASTFCGADLTPDRITSAINKVVERADGQKKWKLKQNIVDDLKNAGKNKEGSHIKAEGGLNVFSIFGAKAAADIMTSSMAEHLYKSHRDRSFDAGEMASFFSQHDVELQFEGDVVRVRGIMVRQFNRNDFSQAVNIGTVQALRSHKNYKQTFLTRLGGTDGGSEDVVVMASDNRPPPLQLILGLDDAVNTSTLRFDAAISSEGTVAKKLIEKLKLEAGARAIPAVVTAIGPQFVGKTRILDDVCGVEFPMMGVRPSTVGDTSGLVALTTEIRSRRGQHFRLVVLDAEGLFSTRDLVDEQTQAMWEKKKTAFQFHTSSAIVLIFNSFTEARDKLNEMTPLVEEMRDALAQAATQLSHSPALFIVLNKQSEADLATFTEWCNSSTVLGNRILEQTHQAYSRILSSPFVRLFSRRSLHLLPSWNNIPNGRMLYESSIRDLRRRILEVAEATPFFSQDEHLWAEYVERALEFINKNDFRGFPGALAIFEETQEAKVKLAIARSFGTFPADRIMDDSQYKVYLGKALDTFDHEARGYKKTDFRAQLETKCELLYQKDLSVCNHATCDCAVQSSSCVLRKDICRQSGNAHRCKGHDINCTNFSYCGKVARHISCPAPAGVSITPVPECCMDNSCAFPGCIAASNRCIRKLGHADHHLCNTHASKAGQCLGNTCIEPGCTQDCTDDLNHSGRHHTCNSHRHVGVLCYRANCVANCGQLCSDAALMASHGRHHTCASHRSLAGQCYLHRCEATGCPNRCTRQFGHARVHTCNSHQTLAAQCYDHTCVVVGCPHRCTRHFGHGGVHTCSTEKHQLLGTGFVLKNEHGRCLARAVDGGPYIGGQTVFDIIVHDPHTRIVRIVDRHTGTRLSNCGGRGWFVGGEHDLPSQLYQIIRHHNTGHRAGVWGVAVRSCKDHKFLLVPHDGCVSYQPHCDNGEWYDLE